MNKALAHLHTINKHKVKVTYLCFRCHLYKQGLLHDLSKYSYIELKTGFHYYQGFRSPIDAEKEEKGCIIKGETNIIGNIGLILA